MENFFVDFHCHSTLRALNSTPLNNYRNLWDKTFNPEINTPIGRWARFQTREIAKESQSNLTDYTNSKTRVIFDSIYPVEKGWYQFRKLPKFLVGKRSKEELMLVSFGIEYERMIRLVENPGYFEELKESYDFLNSGQEHSPNGKNYYKLVKNYKELRRILKNEPECIAVVVSIEGAHALECGAPCTLSLNYSEHKNILSKNIASLKSWPFPVFYMNLAHHFHNQLCGHARSFKSPISLMFNQGVGLNDGIYDLGWFVIEELLSKTNGKRILIDVKHMSLKARKEYYNYLIKYNKGNPKNKIPVICSHGAVNGFDTIEESGRVPDVMKKLKGSYFHNWSINLSSEEINIIHESEGIIGVMVDKGLLGGPDLLKEIKSLPIEQQKEAYVKLYLDNVFFIVKAIGKKTAWDIVSLGTDYDGIITHIDFYKNAASLENFRNDLFSYLIKNQYQEHLWYGYTPKEILDKLFRKNALNFLKRNFH